MAELCVNHVSVKLFKVPHSFFGVRTGRDLRCHQFQLPPSHSADLEAEAQAGAA